MLSFEMLVNCFVLHISILAFRTLQHFLGRIDKSTNRHRQSDKSTKRQIDKSTKRQIDKSTNRHRQSDKSTNRQIDKATSTNRQYEVYAPLLQIQLCQASRDNHMRVLSVDWVLMLKWEDDVGYHVALIDCEQDSSKTDIHYMLKPNSHSIIHSRMSLTSANTLQEVKSIECYAHLPLEVEEIIVRKNAHSEYGGNTGVNRFISNLLVQ